MIFLRTHSQYVRELKCKLHSNDSKAYASTHCAIPEDTCQWGEDSEADLNTQKVELIAQVPGDGIGFIK